MRTFICVYASPHYLYKLETCLESRAVNSRFPRGLRIQLGELDSDSNLKNRFTLE